GVNHSGSAAVVESAISTLDARSYQTATRLADGRILLAGGRAGGYGWGTHDTIELFTPGATSSTGSFAYAPGSSSCSGAPCVRMAGPRMAHAAVRVDGTATWLNGAVLFAGGSFDYSFQLMGIQAVLPE